MVNSQNWTDPRLSCMDNFGKAKLLLIFPNHFKCQQVQINIAYLHVVYWCPRVDKLIEIYRKPRVVVSRY